MKKNGNSKENRKLVWQGIGVAVPLLVLVFAILTFCFSFAWFSQSKSVQTKGMAVVINAATLTEYLDSGSFRLADELDHITSEDGDYNDVTIPGTSAIYKVMLLNDTDKEIMVDRFGFETPIVFMGSEQEAASIVGQANYEREGVTGVDDYDEFPRYEDGVGYYFGTQLESRLVKIVLLTEQATDEGGQPREEYGIMKGNTMLYYYGDPIVDITDEDGVIDDTQRPMQLILEFEDGLVTTESLELYGDDYDSNDTDITIPPHCTIIFYVQMKFENFETSQDYYKGFAFSDSLDGRVNKYYERCARSIYVDFVDQTELTNH